MRFFKENYDSIIKLYINQIGIAIFSLFLYTAVGAIKSDNGVASPMAKGIVSICALLFYFVLIYTVVWEIGAKDRIRIDAGKAERERGKGALMGFIANIPNFIITAISLLSIGLYLLGAGEGFYSVFVVLNFIFRLFLGPYLGVIQWMTDSLSLSLELQFSLSPIAL